MVLDEKMDSRHLKHVRFSLDMWEGQLKFHTSDTQSKSTIVNIASTEETRKNDDWFAETDEARRYG